MLSCFFLHFYQPANQQDDILERIVAESYRPLLKGFLKNPDFRASFNVNGVLIKLLQEKGYEDVIDSFRRLLKSGQIEITGSACYHAVLPLISESEVLRQIELDGNIKKDVFGKLYQRRGFFPPELGFSESLAKQVRNLGYTWMLASSLALGNDKSVSFEHLYALENLQDFSIFFRQRRISNLILSANCRGTETLYSSIQNIYKPDGYFVAAMDAETFGHHRPGLVDVLFEYFSSPHFSPARVSDLLEEGKFPEKVVSSLRSCSWVNEEQDFWLYGKESDTPVDPFSLWRDPENKIHKLQWEFTHFVLDVLKSCGGSCTEARDLMDSAIASDQFWWASSKPWWSLEMVELGAYDLLQVTKAIPAVSQKVLAKAKSYYASILEKAFEWQRSGKIREGYRRSRGSWSDKPFKNRTSKDWYNLIILEFEDEMNKAVGKQEFERAIMWRDAIYKLSSGLDVYDIKHVIDELWAVRNLPTLKSYLEHEKGEFSEFIKKHLLEMSPEEVKQAKKKLKAGYYVSLKT